MIISPEIDSIRQEFIVKKNKLDEEFIKEEANTAHQNNLFEVKDLLKSYSRAADKAARSLWQIYFSETNHYLTLCAVGGYGRRELFPQSDVDLVILHSDTLSPEHKTAIELFVQQLWDIGLKASQSIRDTHLIIQDCQQDHTILTNLLSSRYICGNKELHRNLKKNILEQHPIPKNDYFNDKNQEYILRHKKHTNTEYNLEPNVKEAPGGLRDVHSILWIAHYTLGAHSLFQLLKRNIIHREELVALKKGYEFVSRVRFSLHLHTKRDENRLLFDYQKTIAHRLGFREGKGNQAVEAFMKAFYRHASTLASLVSILIEHIEEEMIEAKKLPKKEPLNSRFHLINNKIAANSINVFSETPSALLEIFYLLGQEPHFKGIRASTIRLIRQNRKLIDEKYRSDPKNTELFLKILNSPYRLFSHLQRMKRYGILGRYLPQFGEVIGQMQYDLFHVYTVDAHALIVIQNMRLLRHTATRESFPIAAQLIHTINDRMLLYIAGLFHDIAKGRNGDHSLLGAQDVEIFCQQHQLSQDDTDLVVWLVRFHLIMSTTAQKSDINDFQVIKTFAQEVKNQERLDYLYLLTICDIGATNPKLLNPWRLSLINQLYLETKLAFKRGFEQSDLNQSKSNRTKESATQILRQKGLFTHQFKSLWQDFGDEYFAKTSAKDVAWHTEAILKNKTFGLPLIIVGLTQESPAQVYTQIFIYTADRPYLFSTTVNALFEMQLNILDARVMTSLSGYTLDTFIVDDDTSGIIANTPQIFRTIRAQLNTALLKTTPNKKPFFPPIPRKYKHFEIPLIVEFSSLIQQSQTLMKVEALDRPGLLAQLGLVFSKHAINIHAAKILTFGEKAEDYFYITNHQNLPLNDIQCLSLRNEIIQELSTSK